MGYLNFDKDKLVNLSYSLERETLRTNRGGAYSFTTLAGCNTRKYHGLLVVRLKEQDGGKHVLLSSLDESIIQHEAQFNLGIHKFPGDYYEPKGHKYIRNFEFDTIPKHTFRVGGVILTRTKLLVENENQVLIKYTLEEANSPTKLRFKPFLAFRNVHNLSKANLYANSKYTPVANGIKMNLYDGYPEFFMQISKECDFVPVPDWYKNIEYIREQERGYEFQEDLFVPGYFEVSIAKGESIIFSASTSDQKPATFEKKYEIEKKCRIPRDSFINCLRNAGKQFLWDRQDGKDLIAGYPWYESIPRQTISSLPGLFLLQGDVKNFEAVLQTNLKRLKNGLLPKYVGQDSFFDASDAPLLVFSALQKLVEFRSLAEIWTTYGTSLKEILDNYRKGTDFNIHMLENGLIHAKLDGVALTWMDDYKDGIPVTQRGGLAVEINALWYNAVCFALELAEAAGDTSFVKKWKNLPALIGESFLSHFWCEECSKLADYIDGDYTDWSIRPNMLIAAAQDHTPLSRTQRKSIVSLVKNELLTPVGIRTLSPEDFAYKGFSGEKADDFSEVAHQGTAYPFLIYHFVKTYLEVHKTGGLSFARNCLEGFKNEMSENCIGTLSEAYEGNPPHTARGSISQACNVAGVIMANAIVEKFEEEIKPVAK
ncbi:MAG: amylo-alpha-1,6-glucosidase [Prolixibacteraceae bacterium]|jgi:predicted glycogen debranching enzyme|nr:amylo-alpha-1,6-glucosidase [Prolixibacteraceae bacterium]